MIQMVRTRELTGALYAKTARHKPQDGQPDCTGVIRIHGRTYVLEGRLKKNERGEYLFLSAVPVGIQPALLRKTKRKRKGK